MSANYLSTIFWILLVCAQWQQILAAHSVNSICFGDLHLDLPVRYLHIQLVENGQNLTESGGPIDVKFSKSETCRFARSVIDRFDGSYIIRFRLWFSCESIEFDAFWNGQPLCGGTVRAHRGELLHLHPEQCYCNHKLQTTPEWIEHAECSDEPQLETDLRRWKSIDLKEVIPWIEAKWGGEENRYSTSLCRYKFLNNQIYRHCYGEHVGFHQFSDDFFLSISEKMALPNIEFFLNLGDYPLENDLENPLPIVSWCGSTENADIVLPTYEIVNAMMLSLDRSSLDIQAARGDTHTPWEKRKDTAVFRGRDSHELRLKIADLARKRPELVTGGITRYFFYPKEKHSPVVESASFYDFFTHKYVISIDGTVAAYRMPYLLAGDSIILKSDSKFYEHFYSRMIPYEHYIPFDETNIEEAIEKARKADHVKIRSNMNRLVMDHLQPKHIFCYYAKFFQEYYKLQKNFDSNVAGMDLVERKVNERVYCNCADEDKKKSEELFARSVIDRFDGSYIIRFRLWFSCESIEFDAFWNGQPLCGGTVRAHRGELLHLHPEQCYCNHKLQTTPEWIEHAECSDEPQLETDLRRWKSIDLKEVIPWIEAKWGGEENRYSTSLCRYKFLNNQIYRHCYGEHVGFHQFSDDFFLSISEKMALPNIEFFLNLGDYPLENDLENPLPIVSWCGSTENADIVLPTYEIVNAMMLSLDRSSLDIQAARGDTHTPWEKRKDTAVFRGRDSHELRLKIADLARKRPELVTGGITRYFFYPKEKHSPVVESASFYDFFTHKYVISIDGTVAAYRMPYLLAGDSIILKSDSKFYEHFYSRMIPYEHYIPFDETNIEEAIEKARKADHVKIRSNMNRLVMDHLQPKHIFCYYAKFFQEYYKLQKNFDSNVAGMDLVERKVNERVYCNCADEDKKKSEEL